MRQRSRLEAWKQRARELKRETYALYLACKDHRTPWYAKVTAACVVAYAFSPIDLIPDFIPVLGYLDDLVLVPMGVALVHRMIPETVVRDCRERAHAAMDHHKPTNWAAAGVVIAVWLVLLAIGIGWCIHVIQSRGAFTG